MLFTIEVNNNPITARRGETVLECLNRNGIQVPTLCHMQGYSPTGACRICVVEVEGRPELIPSCSHPVEEWMRIKTHSPRVIRARKTIVELLLSNHPDDCLFCERDSNCELQDLAIGLNIRERRFTGKKNSQKKDYASTSILRDPSKCILCGRCVRLCETEQEVAAVDFISRGNKMTIGTSYNQGLSIKNCHNCGQCILVCPTGALYEKQHIHKVHEALHNPDRKVVAGFSPATAIALAEETGQRPGKDISGLITAALNKTGFSKVFDVAFAADLAIIENAALLANRIQEGESMPLFSSCCPSWIHYAESSHPHLLPHISSVMSPQQILASLVKNVYAAEAGLSPGDLFYTSLMPCTAKKHEAQRQEMALEEGNLVDAVLTTRELSTFIKLHGIDIQSIEATLPNPPFSLRSTAGKLYGVGGGVTEALLRTLYYNLTGEEMEPVKISELRGGNGRKEFRLKAGKYQIGVACVSGMSSARKLLDEISNGRRDLHFVEVMACPGGCINGGGQPIGAGEKEIKARAKGLYETDDKENIRVAHKNPQIIELYEKHLGVPLSETAKKFLHKKI